MADGIHILLKRANDYITETEPVEYIEKIANYILEYGEPLFLKNEGYLIIGDGVHSVKELIEEQNRFFGPANNTTLYEYAQYIKDASEYTTNVNEIANTGYVTDAIEKIIRAFITAFNGKGSQSKTITAISFDPSSETTPFTVTFEDIKIDASKEGIIENLKTVIQETKVNDSSHSDTADTVSVVNANDIADDCYIIGTKGAGTQTLYRANAYSSPIGKANTNGIKFNGTSGVLYGAAWNDVAEYRIGEGVPGQCVCEDNNGNCKPSIKRLQKNPNIVSDTFGFIIGDSSDGNIPLAIAGTVLAITDKNRDKFKIGDVVCSGKNGTVSKMSRLEIILYPDRILGTVCKIPLVDTWNNVKINGRVWIKIK